LLTFNALQWKHSVEACADSLAKIPPERVFTIKYENFTRNITSEWSALQDFIGVSRYPELSPDIKPSIAEKEEKT
jgi:hypothetical protein